MYLLNYSSIILFVNYGYIYIFFFLTRKCRQMFLSDFDETWWVFLL